MLGVGSIARVAGPAVTATPCLFYYAAATVPVEHPPTKMREKQRQRARRLISENSDDKSCPYTGSDDRPAHIVDQIEHKLVDNVQ